MNTLIKPPCCNNKIDDKKLVVANTPVKPIGTENTNLLFADTYSITAKTVAIALKECLEAKQLRKDQIDFLLHRSGRSTFIAKAVKRAERGMYGKTNGAITSHKDLVHCIDYLVQNDKTVRENIYSDLTNYNRTLKLNKAGIVPDRYERHFVDDNCYLRPALLDMSKPETIIYTQFGFGDELQCCSIVQFILNINTQLGISCDCNTPGIEDVIESALYAGKLSGLTISQMIHSATEYLNWEVYNMRSKTQQAVLRHARRFKNEVWTDELAGIIYNEFAARIKEANKILCPNSELYIIAKKYNLAGESI